MLKWLWQFIDPRVLVVGLVVGFGGLSLLGWATSSTNMFSDYLRSHKFISPETMFVPTSRQIIALAEAKLPADKIAVIVGGSSVFRGAGQSANGLWSVALQRDLGERYAVLNLALNGGSPGGQALYATEHLLQQGRKVIYVADVGLLPHIPPSDSDAYTQMFFDAQAEGYLQDHPERDAAVQTAQAKVWEERRLQALTNAVFHADDLWTYVGYKLFFTIWTPVMRDDPFKAREAYPDDEADCVPAKAYSLNLEANTEITKALAGNLFPTQPKTNADEAFAPITRHNSMLVLTPNSPFFLDKLSAEERDQYAANMQTIASAYAADEIETHVIPSVFDASTDYCDRVHLAPAGGVKLAAEVAKLVEAKAVALGY